MKDTKNGDFRFSDVFFKKDPLRRSENVLIAFSVIDYITYPKIREFLGWEREIDRPECSKGGHRSLCVGLIGS